MVLHIGIHTSYKSESSYFCLVILISMRYSHNINNNNNNRFIISTIGPTWHSLLVTKGFLRLLSASYALCSITFAYLELQTLHIACHKILYSMRHKQTHAGTNINVPLDIGDSVHIKKLRHNLCAFVLLQTWVIGMSFRRSS